MSWYIRISFNTTHFNAVLNMGLRRFTGIAG